MPENPRIPAPIFLSYAREDADAARRIAEALRGFGLEVWFDLSELRGGDAWDANIKKQIRDCALFIPIISANTQAREEGYFRREWLLAVERKRDMAENRAFIVPVIVDDTREGDANVPETFLKAHCTRLVNGEPTAAFVEQVKRLAQGPRAATGGTRPATPVAPAPQSKRAIPWATVVLAVAVVGLVAYVFLRPGGHAPSSPAPAAATETAPVPAPASVMAAPVNNADSHSLAVLPFVDMSQAKDQEYFSDGLAEELLDLLAKVPGLQVTSRTSAFAYKGKEVSLAQIARELNVAHILEGSVRKSGTHLRITAQLIDARTDRHIWSETYDRSLDDIFAVQDEISAAVVGQLKISLLGAAPKAKAADPRAYALYLQARQLSRQFTTESLKQAVSLNQQALGIDPNLAASWANLAECYMIQSDFGGRPNIEGYSLARDAASKAIAADPNCAAAYTALGNVQAAFDGDAPSAARSFERALELDPANTEIITQAMRFIRGLGRFDTVIRMGEYVVAHDPLNALAHSTLGTAYSRAGRLDEAIASVRTSLRLAPHRSLGHWTLGSIYLQQGDAQSALAEMQLEPGGSWHLDGLTLAYFALGRKAESDAALAELISKYEKESAWNIAYGYAFRGEADKAFEWLDKAIEYRDPGVSLTQVQWLFQNVEKDPRWLLFLRRIGHTPEQLAAIKFDVHLPEK
ncbi:MAG TPA: TIR domain-containing protein [Candidatus Didemnitutus sp.]|jgi:TolB-like protein